MQGTMIFGRIRGGFIALSGLACLGFVFADASTGVGGDIEMMVVGPTALFGGMLAMLRPTALSRPAGIDKLMMLGVTAVGLACSGILVAVCGVAP